MIRPYALVILFLFGAQYLSTGQEQVLIVREANLVIRGKTSIGKFDCHCAVQAESDTIVLGKTLKEGVLQFTIPVESFDCGKRLLNKDFCKTLKSGEYPNIKVILQSFEKVAGHYSGDMRLELVGKDKLLDNVAFQTTRNEDQSFLSSQIDIELSDLELKAPSRFFGIIKLHDRLSIEVTLGL